MFIVKAQPNIEVEIELRLPYCAIHCHTLVVVLLTNQLSSAWLLIFKERRSQSQSQSRLVASCAFEPVCTLFPLANMSYTLCCSHSTYTYRGYMRFSAPAKKKIKNTNLLFDFWPKREQPFGILCAFEQILIVPDQNRQLHMSPTNSGTSSGRTWSWNMGKLPIASPFASDNFLMKFCGYKEL